MLLLNFYVCNMIICVLCEFVQWIIKYVLIEKISTAVLSKILKHFFLLCILSQPPTQLFPSWNRLKTLSKLKFLHSCRECSLSQLIARRFSSLYLFKGLLFPSNTQAYRKLKIWKLVSNFKFIVYPFGRKILVNTRILKWQ